MDESKKIPHMVIATYQDGNGDYRKKIVHCSVASAEEAYEKLRGCYPEWDKLQDPWVWGQINKDTFTSVFVYESKLVADSDRWSRYRDRQIRRRVAEVKDEKRAEDVKELRRIVDKWNLSPLELLATMSDEEAEENA